MGGPNSGRRLPEEMRSEILRALADPGATYVGIASRVGCSAATVAEIARSAGHVAKTGRPRRVAEEDPALPPGRWALDPRTRVLRYEAAS